MTALDAAAIHRGLNGATRERLAALEVFDTIGSTSTHLADTARPETGCVQVALAEEQTAGRGRQNRHWVSPRGAGLYQSLAFASTSPRMHLSPLTLALGVGAIAALERCGVTGVRLKWPNDLVAHDSKLAGLLTETLAIDGRLLVIAGIGVNVYMDEATRAAARSGRAQRAVAIQHIAATVPDRNALAAAMTNALTAVFVNYEAQGFAAYADAWRAADWLCGRRISIESPAATHTGIAAGVDDAGALKLDTATGRIAVVSGSVVLHEAAS